MIELKQNGEIDTNLLTKDELEAIVSLKLDIAKRELENLK